MKRAVLALCLLAGGVQAQTLPTPHYGGLTLEGSSSGSTAIAAPASGSTITITLPGTAGTSGQVLTHGAGNTLAWSSAASVANAIALEAAGASQKISAMPSGDALVTGFSIDPGALLPMVQAGANYGWSLGSIYTVMAFAANYFTNPLNAAAASNAAGQNTSFNGGDGDGTGNGGNASLQGGVGGATSGNGGDVLLTAGSGNGPGVGGNVVIDAGNGATLGNVKMSSLPTADPSVSAAIWTDRGVLELSGSTPAVAHTDVAQSFTKAQRGTPVTLSLSGATATPNYDNGQNFALTLVHASCPCTLANPSTTPVAGQTGQIVVTQSATGSDTLSFGNQFKFSGGTPPTLSTGANAVDVLSYYVVSPTVIAVTALLNFQ